MLITSVLTFFILVNISSIVDKLITRTTKDAFRYSAWLRTFIFYETDDPIRILGWLYRRYTYRESNWARHPQRLRVSRLFIPLLARGVIFVSSIVSIAISIPTNRELSGCASGDFRPRLNETYLVPLELSLGASCHNIPLVSRVGKTRATLLYCSCTQQRTDINSPQDKTVLRLEYDSRFAQIRVVFQTGDVQVDYRYYIEWQGFDGTSFRSDITTSLDPEAHIRVIKNGLARSNFDCPEEDRIGTDPNEGIFVLLNCSVDVLGAIRATEKFVAGALFIEKVPLSQIRVNPRNPRKRNSICRVRVEVASPIVNLIPLFLVLVAISLINVAVGIIVGGSSNTLDCAFHVIKEVMGKDSTSNPLEDSLQHKTLSALPLVKSMRGSEGHIGFLQREDDMPVDEFDDGVIVSKSHQD